MIKRELKTGDLVEVFDGSLVGWTQGILKESYSNKESLPKWLIETQDGTNLVRYIKTEYNHMYEDGCGYLVSI